ncbi:WW domain [Phaffia rhodozyma]|uniref:WW domain n=1 Tax=Phaffia rhodozyma TaxID=264483 RepID=A0A0F7SQE6_PHARH|nr:WW domain [Phaffia rhodozyma]
MDDEDENLVDWGYDDDEEVKGTPSSHGHPASDNADGFDALVGEDTTSQPSKGPSLLSRISGNIQPVFSPTSKKSVQNETQNASNSVRSSPNSGRPTTHRQSNDPTTGDSEKASLIEAAPSQSAPSTSYPASSDPFSTTDQRSSSGHEELPPKISSNRQSTADSVRLKNSRPVDSHVPDAFSTQRRPPPPPLPRSQHSADEATETETTRPSTVTKEGPLSLDGLSAEWEIRTSRTSQGAKYYFNKRTKQSSWERPEGTTATGSNADLNERDRHGSNKSDPTRSDRADTGPDRRRSGDWDRNAASSRLTNYGSRSEDDRRRNRAEGWDLERNRHAGREGRSDISMNERRDRQAAIETAYKRPSGLSSRSASNSFQEAHDWSTPGSRNGQSPSNHRRSSPAPGAAASGERPPSERTSQPTGDRSLDLYRDKSRDKPPFPSTATTDERSNTLPARGEPIPSRDPVSGSEKRPQPVVPSGPRNITLDGPVGGEPYGRRRAPPVAGVNAVSAQGSTMRKWGPAASSVDERKQTTETADVSARENDDKRREEDEAERERTRERERQRQRESDEKKRLEEERKREKNIARSRDKPREVVPAPSPAYDPTAPFELSEEEKALILAKRQRAAQEEHARVIQKRDDHLPDGVQKTGEQATRDAYSRRRQPPETTVTSSYGHEQTSTPVRPTRDGAVRVISSVANSTGARPNMGPSIDLVDLTSPSPPRAVDVESAVPSKRGHDALEPPQSSTQSREKNGNEDGDGDKVKDRVEEPRTNRARHQGIGPDDVNDGQSRPVVPGWGPGSRRVGRGGIPERPPPYGLPRGGGRGGFGRGGRGDAWSGARSR